MANPAPSAPAPPDDPVVRALNAYWGKQVEALRPFAQCYGLDVEPDGTIVWADTREPA